MTVRVRLQRIWTSVEGRISPRALKSIGLLAAGAVLLMGLAVGVALYEIRTNAFAVWIGGVLADTNAGRSAGGRVWQKLRAQAEAQDALDGGEAVALPAGEGDLPEAVLRGRFDMRRVPETGMPGYVAIWRTPVGPGRVEERPLHEVVESFRIFRQGLVVLEGAELPDARYRGQVRERVAALYRQVGDMGAVGDSAEAMDLESLIAVSSELARDVVDQLRREEYATLLREFRSGRVSQILLNRGLGRYQGEVFYHREGTPAVTFEIASDAVAAALGIDE